MITDASEKKQAQKLLESSLKVALRSQGKRRIGFPGGTAEHLLYSQANGTLWYAPDRPRKTSKIPRYWNSFGVFNSDAHSQSIVVETNVPETSNTGQVASFFAKDSATGEILLMHSGRVGGGRRGISKSAFLAWANPSLVDVSTQNGDYRSALVVASVSSSDIVATIWRFVTTVAEFKEAAVSGALDTAAFRERLQRYKAYSKEFTGRKRGLRGAVIDYVTFHGDVVDEICRVREARCKPHERIVKTNLIDLGVESRNLLTELYEVKTSCDRQSLYAALGQLVTHSGSKLAGPNLQCHLVVPAGQQIAPDIRAALQKLSIRVGTFTRRKAGKKYKISVQMR
jgi:hypothetical protein